MSSYMPLPIGSGNNTPTMATNPASAQEDYVYNRLLKERIIWLGSGSKGLKRKLNLLADVGSLSRGS